MPQRKKPAAKPEEKPQVPETVEATPDLPTGVYVVRKEEEGGIGVTITPINVALTEVPTLLEIATRDVREHLGLSPR